MEKIKISLIAQFLCIMLYILLFFLNSNILFLATILAILFILFIPGYNLTKILFPQYSIKFRLGICTIFSLGLEIFAMLIYYIIGISLQNGAPFFFDATILIITFSIISSVLILIAFYRDSKQKQLLINSEEDLQNTKSDVGKNRINLVLSAIFFIVLILLCIDVYNNRIPVATQYDILKFYSDNFSFFSEVSIFFYFLFSIAIVLLIYFAIKFQNKIIFLAFVSVFLYVISILPYFQVGNFFVYDSFFLEEILVNYYDYGLIPNEEHGLTAIFNPADYDSFWLRYATSTFYSILLTDLTKMNLFFSLSYLYPLALCLTPFLLYEILNLLIKNDIKGSLVNVLTLLIIFNPIYLKSGHTASTVVIGFNTFIVLIYFLFLVLKNQHLDTRLIFVLVSLYLFQTLTHIEEALYFLVIVLVGGCLMFLLNATSLKQNEDPIEIKSKRSFFIKYSILFGIFFFSFYLTQEFLGYFSWYISFFENFPFFDTIFSLYSNTRIIAIPFVFETFRALSLVVILVIAISILLIYLLISLLNRYENQISELFLKINDYSNKIRNYLTKGKLKYISQWIIAILIFFFLILFDLYIENFLEYEGIFIIFEVFIVFNYHFILVFIFAKNLLFFKQSKPYEKFLLLIMICLGISFSLFSLSAAKLDLILYDLQKVFYYLIFFNIFLIAGNYFSYLSDRKYKYFLMLFFIMIVGGLNISFRKLKFG